MADPALHLQDLPRVNEIIGVLASNGFGHALERVGLGRRPTTDEVAADSTPFARRLRHALVELGPTFIKLGQVLSVRPDILPADVLREFETLQNRVPPMSMADVRELIEQELHAPLEEVFTEFDDEPLGSASIAQVHRAVTRDGLEVAVKLQRKGIERVIRSDLHILYSLAHAIEGRIQLPGLHTPSDIVREFDSAISMELDFLQELKAMDRMRRHFEGVSGVTVPGTHPRLSTRRVLVMDMVTGEPLRDFMKRAKGNEARRMAHTVMDSTYRQVFEYGFFHGDPHPGNLFVNHRGELVLLDFGVTGTLTGAMQDSIISVFTSMVFRDAETLAMAVYRAGAHSGRVDLKAFIEELEKKMVQYYGASLDDLANPTTFMEIVEMCVRFKITLPAEFAVLSRVIGLVEGEIRALMPGLDIVEEVRPYAQKLVAKRFAPERMAHDLARAVIQAEGHFRELPTQFSQLVMDLENGSITIVTKDPDAAALRAEISAAVLRLSLAALASTVTMGALMFLAAWSPAPFGIPLFGLFGGLLVFFGFGLFGILGVHVLFAQFLNLKRWRQRIVGVLRFFSWRREP